MEPIDPRVDQRLLPDDSFIVVIAEHQAQYKNLPSVRTPKGQVITRWSLTQAERNRIHDGEDVYITIMADGAINPLFATVGVVNWRGDPKPLPSFPSDAKDVPGNYVQKGDGRWYPHP